MIKILLVGDRPYNLVALDAVLEPLGHRLVRVTSGEAAVKALLIHEFALIVLDMQMPRMDGFEATAHTKRRARNCRVPISSLTAAGDSPHHTFRGYAVGAADYLVKLFDPWVLRAKASVFVALFDVNRRLHDQMVLLEAEHLRRSGQGVTVLTGVSAVLAAVDVRLWVVEDAPRDLFALLPVPRAPAGALAAAAALAVQLARLRQYADLLLGCATSPSLRLPGGPGPDAS
uniref:response regulator n=1 Tax=Streptomyces rimosus TaxID=1927 RepID=UPI0004CDB7E2